jgi:hypothetical protein
MLHMNPKASSPFLGEIRPKTYSFHTESIASCLGLSIFSDLTYLGRPVLSMLIRAGPARRRTGRGAALWYAVCRGTGASLGRPRAEGQIQLKKSKIDPS